MSPTELADYIEQAAGYRPAAPAFSRMKHDQGGKLSTALWIALQRALAERDAAVDALHDIALCDKPPYV